MQILTFNKESGYVSQEFSGYKTVQMAFALDEGNLVFVESRVNDTQQWITTDSHVFGMSGIFDVPEGGTEQKYRLRSMKQPLSCEITEKGGGGGGGSQPGPNTVGTDEIINGSVEMEDLNHNVKEKMLTDDDRVTSEDINDFKV